MGEKPSTPDERYQHPTREEIAGLPRWAIVAFAARCARRVLPFFDAAWPRAGESFRSMVFAILDSVEKSAGRASAVEFPANSPYADAGYRFASEHVRGTIFDAANAARAAAIGDRDMLIAMGAAAAADASLAADQYVVHMADLAPSKDYEDTMLRVRADAHAVAPGIHRDFELLCRTARDLGWTDNTPVSSELFDRMSEGSDEGPVRATASTTRVPAAVLESKQREQRTTGAIDTAYGSYHVVIMAILEKFVVSSVFRPKLEQLRTDYDRRWAIDKRQNIFPIVEKAEKAILKACQYAQASLIRDLRRHHEELVTVPGLKCWVDQILSISPRDISLRFADTPADIKELRSIYIGNIQNPQTAAKVIGQANSIDSLTEYTAHDCISDKTLEELISQSAEV